MGVVIKTKLMYQLARYILMFYDQQPIDFLIVIYRKSALMVSQIPKISRKELCQHIGKNSTLINQYRQIKPIKYGKKLHIHAPNYLNSLQYSTFSQMTFLELKYYNEIENVKLHIPHVVLQSFLLNDINRYT